jgi:hypothetical protein
VGCRPASVEIEQLTQQPRPAGQARLRQIGGRKAPAGRQDGTPGQGSPHEPPPGVTSAPNYFLPLRPTKWEGLEPLGKRREEFCAAKVPEGRARGNE